MWIFEVLSVLLLVACVPASIYVGVMSYFQTAGGISRKLGVALSNSLGVFVFTACAGLAFLYKDGFHPDGVASTGIVGVLDTLPGVGLAALAGGALAAVGWLLKLAGKRAEHTE